TSMTVEVRYDDAAAGYARRFTQVLTPVPAAAPVPTEPAPPTGPVAPAGQTPTTPAPPAASPGSRWAPVTMSWPILDAARQEIQYRVTTAAGGVIDAGEWTPTTDPSILVGDLGRRSRTVEVRLIGPPLAEANLDAIQVRVGVAGTADADAQSVFFDASAGVAQSLTLPAAPGAPPGFRFQSTAFRTDGTQHVTDWASTAQPLIVISTRIV
ncbi:MAG TPA: hypothetical protein VHM65_05795, partial [Candidatus Lustribacter sp.]|nr:hypothetical protein [Candidatus Lustribacter sp.]